ncbi:MAG: hypothetical protein Q8M20_10700 [Rhodocyclaceae bacterium]|nr:hypothetical protein [Rhodocyclaceae bacterium]MDZ4215357.1 hypothetical protein [Rhodocyclaceae bacterium]
MIKSLVVTVVLVFSTLALADQSMSLPGAVDADGRKVLTIINKDPPGQRCNNNTQVAVEIANTYRVPIRILPTSLAPGLPAPGVFYGNQLIAADGKEHNGMSSFQIVADVLDFEGAPKQPKTGLIYQEKVRKDFDALKAVIKSGGK